MSTSHENKNEKRFFLKNGLLSMIGTAVSIAVLSKAPKREAEAGAEKEGKKYGMIIDLNRCTGCQSCVVACKAQNKTIQDRFNTEILILEEGNYPDARIFFLPVQCNQCENPLCVPACPLKAIFKLPNGIVLTDWNKCQGLGACVSACPYAARFLDTRYKGKSGGKVDKCDFCLNRLEQGLMPACVEACGANARLFGDINAPEGEFAEYLKRTDLETRRPEKKIGPNIKYVPNVVSIKKCHFDRREKSKISQS